jgi:hypothetical protein
LLILVNPLVEVGLQEVDLLSILQEPWPELLLQLLLSQDDLNVLGGVVNLALLLVNLSVELELEVVVSLERVRVAGEGKRLGLQVKLEI